METLIADLMDGAAEQLSENTATVGAELAAVDRRVGTRVSAPAAMSVLINAFCRAGHAELMRQMLQSGLELLDELETAYVAAGVQPIRRRFDA